MRTVTVVGAAALSLTAGMAAAQIPLRSYFLKDFQYFKPLPADVRTSQNHARFYWNEPVPFSNSNSDGKHLFFDPSFGEYFPFLGFTPAGDAEPDPLRTPGFTFFVEGGAHLLLDWHTESSDVINTDYRIGGGIAARLPAWRSLSFALRFRYFHESTHLGDEYTLYASPIPEFRRYNVSYEAFELFAAADRYGAGDDALRPPLVKRLRIAYLRGYTGFRWLNTGEFDGFTGLFTPSEPIRLANRTEYHLGGELYFRGWPHPDQRRDASWLSRLVAFQTIFLASDFKRENVYDVAAPRREWSRNIVLGLIYGEAFGATSERTIRWELNYYKGINPHGQFRTGTVSYVGLNYVIDF